MEAVKKTRARRLGFLLAVLLLVSIGGGFFYHYWLVFPTMGEGPAGPSVPTAPFARTWSERPVVLLGLGDSVTAGYGASQGLSYVERLAANPPGEFEDMAGCSLSSVYPRLELRNKAVSGSTSFQCLEGQLPGITPYGEEVLGVVVITTGGNDLIHWYGRKPPEENAMFGASLEQATPWIAHFEQRLTRIVEKIQALFPGGCHIFLANIYDPSDEQGNPRIVGLPPWPDMLEILAGYNTVIARVAEAHEGVHLVDIRSAFLGHGFYCRQTWRPHYHSEDPHLWFASNIEDPNDRGYDALRRTFLNVMIPVLAPKD